jgi:hypothetical protein
MAIEELMAIYNLDLKIVNIKEFPFLSSANLHSLGGKQGDGAPPYN